MRVLVTGGSGFIGGHLCERLIGAGYSVRALVRDPSRCSDLRRWGVDIAVGDLRDPSSLRRAAQGIDVVYHCAALFRQETSRKAIWETNVQGTRNLLEAAVQAGLPRFVYCSSTGVHGNVGNVPANETTPFSPALDHFQTSKLEGERAVLQCAAEARLPAVIFRTNAVYGPRDTRFLKLFRTIKRRRFVMLGAGRVRTQWTYIDDLVDGALLCGTHQRAIGNVYILTGREAMTLNRIVQLIAEALDVPSPRLHFPVAPAYLAGLLCEWVCQPFGISPPLYRRRVNFFRMTKSFEISKARREIGFEPKIDMKTGIGRCVEWYQSAGLL